MYFDEGQSPKVVSYTIETTVKLYNQEDEKVVLIECIMKETLLKRLVGGLLIGEGDTG